MNAEREKGLEDLFFFAKEICGLKDLSISTHKPICQMIQRRLVDEKKNVGIVIPRDHFKSSLGSAACLWMFTRRAVLDGKRDYRIMIDTATLTLSTEHVAWIGNQLKGNEHYRELYGDFADRKNGARMGKKRIIVSGRNDIHKEPNFVASGIGAESTGFHSDMMWHDDIIGEKNFQTSLLREKAKGHYRACGDLLEPDGVKLMTATRWHDGDVVGMLLKGDQERTEDKEWEFYVRACINDGLALFPERWPLEKLEKKRNSSSMTTFQWASQWMNDPVQKELSIPFESADLYRPLAAFPTQLRMKTVTIDPNFRDEQQTSGDPACFIVGGFDRFMQWWGLDVQLGFWTASQFIEKLFNIHAQWKPHVYKIERKFTSFLQYAIRSQEKEHGIILPILWIDRDMRSKTARYANLEPMFRSKRVKFSASIEEKVKREMEDELSRCGFSAHDDFLDALSDQFEQVNPVMGTAGEAPTFPVANAGLHPGRVEDPVQQVKAFTMYGQADLDD